MLSSFRHHCLRSTIESGLQRCTPRSIHIHIRTLSHKPSTVPFARRGTRQSSFVYVRGRGDEPNSSLLRRRTLHSSCVRLHGPITRPEPGTGIKITFKDSKGTTLKTVEANEGDDILSIAHEHDIDLEGACEGSVACSTCHVILPQEYYDMLPEPEDDENDMLDMAFGLTETSRLGCQVKLTREMDGIEAMLPAATRNMFVDGKKPTHH